MEKQEVTIQIKTAADLTLPQLTSLFNDGYAGYIVPVNVNEAYVSNHIHQFDVRLDLSPVAISNDRPVGFAFLAVRGVQSWVAGVGIVPDYRKQGIGRMLMLELFERARTAGLASVQLEVIVGNEAAHKLYEAVRMRDTRRVLVLERLPADIALTVWDGVIEESDVEKALSVYEALHSSANPWQRQPESIRKMQPSVTAWLACQNDNVVSYVIGSFSDERISIIDVGVDPAQSAALTALLTTLHNQHSQARATLTNLDEHDPAWPVFEALGYRARLSQDEMQIDL